MSIKSELRLIEDIDVYVANSAFMQNESNWVGTGTTTWTHSDYNNTIRKVTGNTTPLSQEIDIPVGIVSTTYNQNAKAYKVSYSIYNNSTGEAFTAVLGNASGTTRTLSGTYTDIFYVHPYSGTTTISSPDCTEVYQSGETMSIEWDFPTNVKLELYLTPSTLIQTITAQTSSTGFTWTVPQLTGGTYYIKSTGNEGFDTYTGKSCNFTFTDPCNPVLVNIYNDPANAAITSWRPPVEVNYPTEYDFIDGVHSPVQPEWAVPAPSYFYSMTLSGANISGISWQLTPKAPALTPYAQITGATNTNTLQFYIYPTSGADPHYLYDYVSVSATTQCGSFSTTQKIYMATLPALIVSGWNYPITGVSYNYTASAALTGSTWFVSGGTITSQFYSGCTVQWDTVVGPGYVGVGKVKYSGEPNYTWQARRVDKGPPWP